MKVVNAIKWSFISVALTAVILFLYLFLSPTAYHDLREQFNKNTLSISLDSGMDKHKIDIYWRSERIGYRKIVDKGTELDVAYKEYGPVFFLVIYDKDTVSTFSEFSTSNWHASDYKFHFTKNAEGKTGCKVSRSPLEQVLY